jgi:hypothetical protein
MNEADRVAARRTQEAILEKQREVERKEQRRRDNIAECSALVPEILLLMPAKDYPGIEELDVKVSVNRKGEPTMGKLGGWDIGEDVTGSDRDGHEITRRVYLDSNGLFILGEAVEKYSSSRYKGGSGELELTQIVRMMNVESLLTDLRKLRETLDSE